MQLSFDQIQDYSFCPGLFYLKHVKKYSIKDKSLTFAMDGNFKKIIYNFFSTVMDGKILTLEEMFALWDEIVYKKKLDPFSIMLSPKDEKFELARKYLDFIKRFHSKHYFLPGAPLVVNTPISIEMPNGHIVSTNFDLAREVMEGNRRIIEIIVLSTEKKQLTTEMIDSDISITFLSYAFRRRFNTKENRIVVYYPKTNNIIETKRESSDYERLYGYIVTIIKAIKHKVFYPRQSFLCGTCPLQKECINLFNPLGAKERTLFIP